MKNCEAQNNKDSSSEEQHYNDGADFWRYDIGANVIPANTRKKETYESWKQWQDKPIPQELHEQWKSSGAFNQGMAIIPGKVWHHIGKKELYLIAIDLDNQKAIEEVALDGLEELAKHIIVEQHRDDFTKAHALLYSHKPFPKKSSDNLTPSLNSKLDANEVPAIEVKGLGAHGILYVTPSIHKNGQPYEIIGTREPIIVNDFVFHINDICKKYGIPYLDGNGEGRTSSTQIPIQDLFQEDFVVVEGHNRHEALLRVMDSLIARNYGILSLAEIKSIARRWNDKHCKPPLDDRQFEKQWKCATDFISGSRRAESEAPQNGEGEGEGEEEREVKRDIEYLDLADELIHKYHLKTVEIIKHVYCFDSRVYANNGQTVVEKDLERRYLRELAIFKKKTAGMSPEQLKKSKIEPPIPWTRKRIDELIGQIERRTYVNIKDFDSDIDWLACDNCMLNLRTYSTAPFSPEFLNTTHIPVEYSDVYARGPAADFFRLVERRNFIYCNCQCPKIMKFLYDVIEAEDVEYILDFIAYCLWRTYKYANYLICEGYGQNGKSILFNLIEKFLGIGNTSAESLERLLDEKFATAQLYQKLVNIDADVSGDILIKDTGKIKKLTGNDEIPGEFKFKTPFKFPNHAKLIFSFNEIPEIKDETDAFFRRPIIISFTRQFFGDKEDPHLLEKLCTDQEFSGLLDECLGRLPRIISHGIRPTTNENIRETYEKYIRSSNTVKYFREKSLQLTNNPEDIVSKDIMYDSYHLFCRANKISPESEQSFSRKLSAMGFDKKQLQRNRKKDYYWVGVKVVDLKEVEDEAQQTFEDLTDEQLFKLKWK